MIYLEHIFNLFSSGKLNFKDFSGKNILLVGGYSLAIPVVKNKPSLHFAQFLKFAFLESGAKSCKLVATPEQDNGEDVPCDYSFELEDLLLPPPDCAEIHEPFDVVFILDGLEKVSNPAKALAAIRNLCVENGQIFLFLRSILDLSTKNWLDYYEDNWRYMPNDIMDFYSDSNPIYFNPMPTLEAFLIGFKKTDAEFHIDENFAFFHCRVRRKITYAESLKLNFFRECQDLKNLAKSEFTDKLQHGYLDKYDFFLSKFRAEQFNLLELGVFNGGSLRMWKKYFPKAEIYGVDIDKNCKKYEESRIHVRIMDLSSIENLKSLFDIQPQIIVDDASHFWSHQISSLMTLFEVLPSGGVFIMEDMETSVNTDLYPGYNDFEISAYDVCERVARVVMSKREDSVGDLLSKEITRIGMATDLIAMIKGSCIFIKR